VSQFHSTLVEWQTGVVVPIFKKDDQRVCLNYRGITLLSLLSLLQGIGEEMEFDHPVLMCFIDLEKAYDRVPQKGGVWSTGTAFMSYPVLV